jgi:hypothetical protein
VKIRKATAVPRACRVFDPLACCCEDKKAHKCSCLAQLLKLKMDRYQKHCGGLRQQGSAVRSALDNASKDRQPSILEPIESGDVILAV